MSVAAALLIAVSADGATAADRLSVAGVRVDWPIQAKQARMLAGQTVTVRVRSTDRRSVITLARVDRAGRVMNVVSRRALRTGTFSAKMPTASVPARYRLQLKIAGRVRREATITAPSASPLWAANCPGVAGPVTMTVDSPTIRAGEALRYRLESRDGSCVSGGGFAPTLFYVHPNGFTEYLQPPHGTPLIGLAPHSVGPGWSHTSGVTMPADAAPGHYRIMDPVRVYITDDLKSHPIIADFTVVP
jgi:hypothetical protein